MRILKYLLGTGLALSVTVAQGQITLSESMLHAIRSAKEKSEPLKNKQIEIEKLKLQQKEVGDKRLPSVAATGGYFVMHSKSSIDLEPTQTPFFPKPLFTGVKNSSTHAHGAFAGVNAQVVLFSGMQIPYAQKALEQKRIGTEYLNENATEDLVQEVVISFDQIEVLNAIQSLIDESQKRLEVEEKRVQRSIEEGFAIPLDKDKIKLAQLELQSKQVELDGAQRLIRKKIAYLTGLSEIEIEQVVNDFQPFVLAKETTNIEEKSEIKALKSFLNAQEFLLKKEKSSLLPQIALMGGVRYTDIFDARLPLGNPPLRLHHLTLLPTTYIGVGANWNIFNGNQRSHKMKQVKMDMESLQNTLSDTRQKLQLLLDKNSENYRVANEKLKLNEQKIQVAKNNLNIAMKQFKEGLIDISERLQIESDYHKVMIEQAQGIQQQRQAALELAKAQGKINF